LRNFIQFVILTATNRLTDIGDGRKLSTGDILFINYVFFQYNLLF